MSAAMAGLSFESTLLKNIFFTANDGQLQFDKLAMCQMDNKNMDDSAAVNYTPPPDPLENYHSNIN